VGWRKVACSSTKAAISLKRAKTDEKLLGLYKNSPTLFRTVPSSTPYGLPFPKIEVCNPNPRLQSLLSQERVKLRTSNLAGVFTGSNTAESLRVHHKHQRHHFLGNFTNINKSPLKCLQKRERGRICRDCPLFEYPLISQTSNFVRTFLVSIGTKAH